MDASIPWGIYAQDVNSNEKTDDAVLLGVICSVRSGRALQAAANQFTNPPKRYMIAVRVEVIPVKGNDDERF